MISLKSIKSALSTPVRFLYGASGTLNAPENFGRVMQRLAKACADGDFYAITSIFSMVPPALVHLLSEQQLSVEMDASWFFASSRTERLRCLAFLVEQGLNVTESSVMHLAQALELDSAWKLLFEMFEMGPIKVQSRLAQYAFLYAISRGLVSVASKLLKPGILQTTSEMPDLGFIQGLNPLWYLHLDNEGSEDGEDGEELALIDTVAETSTELGPCALVLALSTRQYRTACLLIEHRVAPEWGRRHLATSKSAFRHLRDELHGFRHCRWILPHHLMLLERFLLGPPITYNAMLPT